MILHYAYAAVINSLIYLALLTITARMYLGHTIKKLWAKSERKSVRCSPLPPSFFLAQRLPPALFIRPHISGDRPAAEVNLREVFKGALPPKINENTLSHRFTARQKIIC